MKILVILLTLSVLASASYKKAEEFYEAKEYEMAVKEAKSSTDEYSNPKLHFIWAKSAEALGNTNDAMSAYERVVMLDDTNVNARLKLVSIYKNTHRYTLVKSMSKSLKNYQLTPAQRSSLALLVDSEDFSSYKARASFAIGYDDNINVSATSNVLDDYTGVIGNKGELGTLFGRFSGSMSYIHDLDQKGGFYLRADLRAYYQNNSDAHLYDMAVASGEVGIGYAGNGYTLYIPVGYDRVHYLEADMLSQIRVAPKVNVVLDKDIIVNFNMKYSSRSYNQKKFEPLADNSFGFGAGVYYLFGKDFIYANLFMENFSSKKYIHNTYLDKDMLTASIGLNYNPTDWLVSRLDYKFRNGKYSDRSNLKDPTETDTRSDNFNQIEIKFSHYFAKNYEVYISDRYAKNSSNYVMANYTKNIAMFGISANY